MGSEMCIRDRYRAPNRGAKTLVERFDIEPCSDFQPNYQALEGSFSSVSTPKIARKYSLESSRRDLQYLHAFVPIRPQYFSKFSSRIFEIFSQIFKRRRQICSMIVPISANFVGFHNPHTENLKKIQNPRMLRTKISQCSVRVHLIFKNAF